MATMKIILDEDAKRFMADANLYDFDTLGHKVSPECKLDFVNPVPVYVPGLSTPKLVGFAHVYIDGLIVKAEIFMDYATPERLDAEIGGLVCAVPAGDFSLRHDEVDALWIPFISLEMGHSGYYGIGGLLRSGRAGVVIF